MLLLEKTVGIWADSAIVEGEEYESGAAVMRQNTQKEQKQDIEVLCQINARITSYWWLTQHNDGHKPSVSLKSLSGPNNVSECKAFIIYTGKSLP